MDFPKYPKRIYPYPHPLIKLYDEIAQRGPDEWREHDARQKNSFANFIADGWQRLDGRRNRHFEFLLDRLEECEDVMPDGLCQDLDLPIGSTFARAVQNLRDAQMDAKNIVEEDQR